MPLPHMSARLVTRVPIRGKAPVRMSQRQRQLVRLMRNCHQVDMFDIRQ